MGVITRALFEQRDFSDLSILDAFYQSLEGSLRSQLTESGLYMGKSWPFFESFWAYALVCSGTSLWVTLGYVPIVLLAYMLS